MQGTRVSFRDSIHKVSYGKVVTSLLHCSFKVCESTSHHTISRFLYGLYYQPSINTSEIDYHLEKRKKITQKKMGSDEKLGYFQWIASRIMSNDKNAKWVVGGPVLPHRR